MDKPKNFSIPKLKPVKSKDNLRNVDLNSRDAIEIMNIIGRNCINERYKEDWTVDKVSLVDNSLLQNEYSCKRKEFKENGRNPREMAEHYGFLFVKDTVLMSKMIREGLKAKKSVFNPLGDNEFGIYICKYPDVQLKLPTMKNEDTAFIIIFKYMLGRCKAIPPQANILGEPSPNYDSTKSSLSTFINDPSSILFPRSQIYLYEYDDDVLPINRPRHCLPVAVVSFNKATKTQINPLLSNSIQSNTTATSVSTFVNRRRASDQGLNFRPGTYGARNQALKRTSLDQTPLAVENPGFNMEDPLQPSSNTSLLNVIEDQDSGQEKPGNLKQELQTETNVKANLLRSNSDLSPKLPIISDPRRRSAPGQSIYSSGPSSNSILSQSSGNTLDSGLPVNIGEKPLHPFMRKKKKGTVNVSKSPSQMRKNNLVIEKLDYSMSDVANLQPATEEEDSSTNSQAVPSNSENLQPSPAQTNMEKMIKTVNKLFGKSPISNETPKDNSFNQKEMSPISGPHSGYDNSSLMVKSEYIMEDTHTKPENLIEKSKIVISSVESPKSSPIKEEAKASKDTNYVQSLAAQLQNLGDLQDVISKFNFSGDPSPKKVTESFKSEPDISDSVLEHTRTKLFFETQTLDSHNFSEKNFENIDLTTKDKRGDVSTYVEHYQQSTMYDVDNRNVIVNCYGDVDYRQKQTSSRDNSMLQYSNIGQNDRKPAQTFQYPQPLSDQVKFSSNRNSEKTNTPNPLNSESSYLPLFQQPTDSVTISQIDIKCSPKNEGSSLNQKQCEKLDTCACDVLDKEAIVDQLKETKKISSVFNPKIELVDLKQIAEAGVTNCKICKAERDDLAAYISNKKHKSVKKYLQHIELFNDHNEKVKDKTIETNLEEKISKSSVPEKRCSSCGDQEFKDAKRLKSIFDSSTSEADFSWLSEKPKDENEPILPSLNKSCAKDLHDDDNDDDDYSNELIIDLKSDFKVGKDGQSASDPHVSNIFVEKQSVSSFPVSSSNISSEKFKVTQTQTWTELEKYETNYSSTEIHLEKTEKYKLSSSYEDEMDNISISGYEPFQSPVNNIEPAGSDRNLWDQPNQKQELEHCPIDLTPKTNDELHLNHSEFITVPDEKKTAVPSENGISNENIKMESQNSIENLQKEPKSSGIVTDIPHMTEDYERRLKMIQLKFSNPTFPLPSSSNKYKSVKQEIEVIRNCLDNLTEESVNDKQDSPDEENLKSALLHVQTELIMELQDSQFLYRPNQRLPPSLLFDYEKNCLYATGDCFMYLNTFLTKQLYKSLLNIKHDILDGYKEKQNISGPSSRLAYLSDHLNYLLNKRKILIRTLTGSVKPSRLASLEKARRYYIWSIEHMNRSITNYDNCQMKNMNRLLSELTEHTCRIRSELEN